MEDYVLNVNEEVSESENNVKDAGLVKDIVSSPSIKENIKLVDESCYSDQVIELTEDEILLKSACDPLESIPVASAAFPVAFSVRLSSIFPISATPK